MHLPYTRLITFYAPVSVFLYERMQMHSGEVVYSEGWVNRDDSDTWVPLVAWDCKGLEPVVWHPQVSS